MHTPTSAKEEKPQMPATVWKFLCAGTAIVSLGAIGTSILIAKNYSSQIPQTQPKAVFNIASDNCAASSIQREIKRIRQNGFVVNCSPK